MNMWKSGESDVLRESMEASGLFSTPFPMSLFHLTVPELHHFTAGQFFSK